MFIRNKTVPDLVLQWALNSFKREHLIKEVCCRLVVQTDWPPGICLIVDRLDAGQDVI